MKVAHWTIKNNSGMHRVAESFAETERKLGIETVVCNPQSADDYEKSLDADIQVSHTHFPDGLRKKVKKPLKIVWVGHGTPEHVFSTAVEAGLNGGYGHSDGFMLCQNWLRTADAIVTFWPRHQAIWKSLCDKNTIVDCIPLGVDKSFWKPTPSNGKYAGTPSLFTAENSHYIKWPLDLFIAWPWVYPHLDTEAKLHCAYMPQDQHRWFFPLANRNGCSYAAHLSHTAFDRPNLRNAFNSVDFYIGLVRYGDFNRICLEANACGCKTISYAGNPYSDFWVNEGDQRIIAQQLIDIIKGTVTPRKKDTVPDIEETSKGMIAIYQRVLSS